MNSSRAKYPGQILIIICVLFSSTYCSGQYELSSGFDLSYPLLTNHYNTKMNYGQISFGLKIGIAYKPPETQFFPILNFSLGRTRLPLIQFNSQDVAALNFNYINLMINENYIVRFPQSEVFIYGGIGFSDLIRKGITLVGSGTGGMSATVDSTNNITTTFPAINLGLEYNYGQSAGKDLYLTMGLNFQYILLLTGRDTYHITVRETYANFVPYTASLTGNLITPSFYIALHYLLHKHSKSSMYL